MIKKIWKQLKKEKTLISIIALSGLSSVLFQSTIHPNYTNENNSDFRNLKNLKNFTFTAIDKSELINKNQKEFPVVKADNSYLAKANDNQIIEYSYNGIERSEINISSDYKIITFDSYDLANNGFIPIITKKISSNKYYLMIYQSDNPFKNPQTYKLNSDKFNKLAFVDKYLYIFNDQEQASSTTQYYRLDTLTNKFEAKNYFGKLLNKYLTNISPVLVDSNPSNQSIYLITFLDPPTTTPITATSTFTAIKYAFVDHDLNLLKGINFGSSKDEAFSYTLTAATAFSKLNFTSYYYPIPYGTLTSNVIAAISLTDAVLLISLNGGFNFKTIKTPENKKIQSIVFKAYSAYFLFQDNQEILQKLDYNSENFREFQSTKYITNSTSEVKTSGYGLVNVNYDDALIYTDGTINNQYGINGSTIKHLTDKLSFQIFVNGNYFDINSTAGSSTVIPLYGSELKPNLFSVKNFAVNGGVYIVGNILKFLELESNIDSTQLASAATISLPVTTTSWYSNSVSLSVNIILKIKNLLSLQARLNLLWIPVAEIFSRLNIEANNVSAEYIKNTLKPLNYSELNQNESVFKITDATFVIDKINKTETTLNSFSFNALIYFTNGIANTTPTMSVTHEYEFGRTNVAANVFEVYGQQTAINHKIDIFNAIASSNQTIPTTIFNFLPSYVYKSYLNAKTDPSVNDVIDFYNKFISKSGGAFSIPVVYSDDVNGNLTIDFILSREINGTNRYTYTFTGFKKYSDFRVDLKGNEIGNNIFDFQTVPNLSEQIKQQSPYEIATGNSLNSLFNDQIVFDTKINPNLKNNINNIYEFLNNSNLNKMGFEPKITNLSLKNKETLLNAIANGSMSFKFEYQGITNSLAKKLGLDQNFSKTLTYTNMEKISNLFNFKVNKKKAKTVIDDFNSGESSKKFKDAVIKVFDIKGFDLKQTKFDLLWNDEVLDVKITPQRNLFTNTLKILPQNYSFQFSWSAKNAYQLMIRNISITLPIVFVIIILVILFFVYRYKKTNLRRFF